MPRGRKPSPANVRSQKAAVHSKRPNTRPKTEAAPSGSARTLAAPAWLKGEGLKIWKRMTPRLSQAKLLGPADLETFARYCRNFARWLSLQDQIDRDGAIYETETYLGSRREGDDDRPAVKLKRAHAALIVADRIERQLLATEDRFGLNPAERQRIMAQRAQTGVTGDLFDPAPGGKSGKDPATRPSQAADPIETPIGMLN